MSKVAKVLIIAVCCILLLASVTPVGRTVWNRWFYAVHKADDATSYTTRKRVEDSCRAMMSSYTSDWLTFRQYDGSESSEKQNWADQAKMRANKTAATYNEYVLKNSYVWDANVPTDIKTSLQYIE